MDPFKKKRLSIAKRIVQLLDKDPKGPPYLLTAMAISKGLKVDVNSLSGILNKLSKEGGPLLRRNGFGPRGGYGYALRDPTKRISRYVQILEDWL